MIVQDSFSITQDRIEQLIFISDDFLKLVEDINGSRNNTQKTNEALKIHQKLYFSEVILILHTLFETYKSPREISYRKLFIDLSKETPYYKAFLEIQQMYEKTELKGFRHKLIAHKDFGSRKEQNGKHENTSGDPITHYINFIKVKHIENARMIIDSLKELNIKHNREANTSNYSTIYSVLKHTINKSGDSIE